MEKPKLIVISFLIGLVIGLATRCNNQKITTIEKQVEKIKVETLKVVLRDTIYIANKSEIKLFKCDSAILKYDFNLNKLVKLEFDKLNFDKTQLLSKKSEKSESEIEIGIGFLTNTPLVMVGYKNISFLGGYDIKNRNLQVGFMLKGRF